MQNARFVVLTGHLDDYPLSDLVGILRHQQKTGRLLIEYPRAPASFYFHEGELVDAQLNELSGIQAVCVALAQPPSPFNFNPLIRPSRRTIDDSVQRVVSELFGCWDESPLQLEATLPPSTLRDVEPQQLPVAKTVAPAELTGREVLSLPPYTPNKQNRTILAMAAAGLLLLGLSSVIAVTGGFKGRVERVSLAASRVANEVHPATQSSPGQQNNSQLDVHRAAALQNEFPKSKEIQPNSLSDRRRETRILPTLEIGSRQSVENAARPAAANQSSTNEDKNDLKEVNTSVPSVDVVMRIENGRVLQAAVANHKPGMDGYEALALRIARQRRYPAKTTGQETVRIRVAQQD